jgi:hypothetical protein
MTQLQSRLQIDGSISENGGRERVVMSLVPIYDMSLGLSILLMMAA